MTWTVSILKTSWATSVSTSKLKKGVLIDFPDFNNQRSIHVEQVGVLGTSIRPLGWGFHPVQILISSFSPSTYCCKILASITLLWIRGPIPPSITQRFSLLLFSLLLSSSILVSGTKCVSPNELLSDRESPVYWYNTSSYLDHSVTFGNNKNQTKLHPY